MGQKDYTSIELFGLVGRRELLLRNLGILALRISDDVRGLPETMPIFS